MSSPENGRRNALLDELRAAAPPAPDRLRVRIDELAAANPVQPPALLERVSLRRAVLVLAPAIVAIGLGVAVVGGLSGAGDDAVGGAAPSASEAREGTPLYAEKQRLRRADGQSASGAASPDTTPSPARALGGSGGRAANTGLPPARGRAQDYRASFRLRVESLDDLSRRTKQAIRLTRGWGGYVVSADYDIPGREGDARLELRVPVRHVQGAVQRFSELGVILAQDVAIRDVQGRLDRYTRELLALRERIANIRARLAEPDVSARERAQLELRLARARRAVTELTADRAAVARRASFASVTLTLTTRDRAAPADDAGRIERAVDDAAAILAKELAFALYALIVAAPFLVLAAAAIFAARTGRRRADERLLERA